MLAGARFLVSALLLLASLATPALAQVLTMERVGRPFHHGPGIVALDARRVLLCWYAGSDERAADSVILCASSGDGGRSWGGARVAVPAGEQAIGAPAPARAVGNVVLAATGGQSVAMIYGVVQSRRSHGVELCRNWRCGRVEIRFSSDAGVYWERARRFDDRDGALPRARPLRVDGVDLVPVYLEAGSSSVIATSLAAWRAGAAPAQIEPIPGRGGLIQPALVTHGGQVLAFLRDQRARNVFMSRRVDGGWSAAVPTSLENPGSAVDAFIDTRGAIQVVHNPGRRGRAALAVARTADGVRFERACNLFRPAAYGEAGYPSVTALAPSEWLIAFSGHDKTSMHITRINQTWLDSCSR